MGYEAYCDLTDTSPNEETINKIREIIKQIKHVHDHKLRSRQIGNKYYIDVELNINNNLSASSGHHIGEHVRFEIFKRIKNVKEITIHINPHNCQHVENFMHENVVLLPIQDEVEKEIIELMIGCDFRLLNVNCYYFDDNTLDISMDLMNMNKNNEIVQKDLLELKRKIKNKLKYINNINMNVNVC